MEIEGGGGEETKEAEDRPQVWWGRETGKDKGRQRWKDRVSKGKQGTGEKRKRDGARVGGAVKRNTRKRQKQREKEREREEKGKQPNIERK